MGVQGIFWVDCDFFKFTSNFHNGDELGKVQKNSPQRIGKKIEIFYSARLNSQKTDLVQNKEKMTTTMTNFRKLQIKIYKEKEKPKNQRYVALHDLIPC